MSDDAAIDDSARVLDEPAPMLIEIFLPAYNLTAKQYSIEIDAPIAVVYPVVRKMDLRRSHLIRFIFFVRSIPALLQKRPALGLTLDEMDKTGFFLLAEAPPHELLIGFVGRIWTSHGGLLRVDPADLLYVYHAGIPQGRHQLHTDATG